MVDDEPRVGMAIDERRARVHIAPKQYVDRKIVLHGRAEDPVEARVVRLALRLLRQDDANADCARRLLPVGDDIGHRRMSGSTGLMIANRPGWARCTSTA